MPDYSKTIIYKIQHEDNEELIYVGSTTDFTKRKYRHKYNCINPNYQNRKLYKMINDNGDWEAFKMIQIKEFPCNNKREAEAEEDKVMLELKANMNDRRASRSHKGYYENNKEQITQKKKDYRDKNKEQLSQKRKDYCDKNKDKIIDYHKEYRDKNKEKIVENKKQYYELNKEKILEKVTCECGCVVVKKCLLRHKKSTKHIKLLNESTEQ